MTISHPETQCAYCIQELNLCPSSVFPEALYREKEQKFAVYLHPLIFLVLSIFASKKFSRARAFGTLYLRDCIDWLYLIDQMELSHSFCGARKGGKVEKKGKVLIFACSVTLPRRGKRLGR